ncbi:DUF3267 domain-containing protein [Virgibacillus oceani]|uniref:Membrane protein YhaJ n=1 Tax=Virgibacillus oceani TaxID=1479511 RepID=A0A917HCK5_9BACI|nr:DUF3267 domain-containing protein [Virgibacillus oceani]GGG74918.1 putative membrane protein YhaJ [Virgibacillus oceani]
MNCWKSININKEFGMNRIYISSFLSGLMTFVFLYVPFSIIHGSTNVNEFGIFPFTAALILLPVIHTFMHILPLIMLKKRSKFNYRLKNKIKPSFTYYPNAYLSKPVSLLVALAPTLFITVPGLIASYLFQDFYVYILLFTSIHIGFSFMDFLYVIHIVKAPKKAFIENGKGGFDILVKAQN